ncbi:MAG: CGNR zinc finger domain-containing protein [Tetrasphaera sp.]
MVFTRDTELALLAAVELANSAGEPDELLEPGQLTEFLDRFGYTGVRAVGAAELDRVRAIRVRLRELLLARDERAVTLVNAVLAEHRAIPQLVRHDDLGWHFHCSPEPARLDVRILVETAMALTDVIRAGESSRLDVCADEGCQGIVLDLSRNRSRRYCSTACGNRNAVAAYRARQGTRS